MELVHELFVTAFVAIIVSFVVAKLVSIATKGDAERDLRLKSSEDVHGERVVEETKFDGRLRVQSTKSKKKVRFADESVRQVDEFEGIEERRCDSAVICEVGHQIEAVEVVGVSVGSDPKAAEEIVGGIEIVEIKELDAVTNFNELVVEEGSEGKKEDDIGSVINEGNVTVDSPLEKEIVNECERGRAADKSEESRGSDEFEEKVGDSALISGSTGPIEVVEVGGLSVDSSEEQLTREAVAVAEIVGCSGKEATDFDTVAIKEEDAMTKVVEVRGLSVDSSEAQLTREATAESEIVGCSGKQAADVDTVAIKEEDAMTNLDGLAVEQGSKGKEADDIERENKGEDAVTNMDGLGVKEGCERKEVEDIETAIKEGNENTDLASKGKIFENAELDMNLDEVSASSKNDIVVAQDVESGIELGQNKGDVKEEELVGDEEDDWEGIERSELDEVFTAAAKYVASWGKDERLANAGSDVQMQFYGLHKVAMEGPCHEPQPMALKISSRAKWNAWQRMGKMNPEVAMEQYIALLSDKVPGWMEGKSSGDDHAGSLEPGMPAAPYPDICTSPLNQQNSTEKRELENSGADGGV